MVNCVSKHVLKSFKDDGQGIDIEKVRQKALMSGLINPEQVLEHQDPKALISLCTTSSPTPRPEI
jgi:chemotaxis protein histidine kinase CheA